jgi:hypothetical protein
LPGTKPSWGLNKKGGDEMKWLFRIFVILFFSSITANYTYPCSSAAYIDSDKTILWINFDRTDVSEAIYCEIKPFMCYGVKGFSYKSKLREDWMSHGMNEYGLAITTQSPPNEEQRPNAKYYRPAGDWLKKFKTVGEALLEIEKKKGYHLVAPLFRILADRDRIAIIEAYSPSTYKIVSLESGYLVHTNHYRFPELFDCNEKMNAKPKQTEGSEGRARILERFLEKTENKTIETFKEISLLPGIGRKITIANIIFYIPHNNEKPKVIYRLPQSKDNTNWITN